MSEEIWRDIPEYEGLYEASSHGRVRSKEGRISIKVREDGASYTQRLKSRVLKEKKVTSKNTRRNDKRVDLWKDKKPKTMYVARLVAMTFIRMPNPNEQVNHINGDFRDNRVENLEWVSQTENIRHQFDNNLAHQYNTKLINSKTMVEYSFMSQIKASLFLGRSKSYINYHVRMGRKKIYSSTGEEYIISD